MHTHIHLISRRKGDVSEPKGGVRGVIPGKQSYWKYNKIFRPFNTLMKSFFQK